MGETLRKVFILTIEDNADGEMLYQVKVFSTKNKAKKAMTEQARTMQNDVNSAFYKFGSEKNSEDFDVEESETHLYVKTVNDDYHCEMNIIECEVK